jgi:hypothetical protein
MKTQENTIQIFGREHLLTNARTKDEIIRRFNCHDELVEALKAIYSDSQLPKVVKEFYSKQIEQALSESEA